ncbi:MAG: hypothetical protein Roseis2KO_15210 [Roseivirga sp.]
MFRHRKQWDESLDFDWHFIKREWLKYWDHRKNIFYEKSPPNLLRATSIEKVFSPVYFIVFVRNPYAHCESFIRKNKYSPEVAARFVVNCLKYQKSNLEKLSNVVLVKYEELTETPEKCAERLIDFLPALGRLDFKKKYDAHNFKQTALPIANLNDEKINCLKPAQIEQMNTVFVEKRELLRWFGYELTGV